MGKQKSREGERGHPSASELGRPRAHEGRNLPWLLRCVRGRPRTGPARHLEDLALGPQHLLRPGYRQFSLGGLTRLSSSDHPLKVNAPPTCPLKLSVVIFPGHGALSAYVHWKPHLWYLHLRLFSRTSPRVFKLKCITLCAGHVHMDILRPLPQTNRFLNRAQCPPPASLFGFSFIPHHVRSVP